MDLSVRLGLQLGYLGSLGAPGFLCMYERYFFISNTSYHIGRTISVFGVSSSCVYASLYIFFIFLVISTRLANGVNYPTRAEKKIEKKKMWIVIDLWAFFIVV